MGLPEFALIFVTDPVDSEIFLIEVEGPALDEDLDSVDRSHELLMHELNDQLRLESRVKLPGGLHLVEIESELNDDDGEFNRYTFRGIQYGKGPTIEQFRLTHNALHQLQPAGPSEASFWNEVPKAVVEKMSTACNC